MSDKQVSIIFMNPDVISSIRREASSMFQISPANRVAQWQTQICLLCLVKEMMQDQASCVKIQVPQWMLCPWRGSETAALARRYPRYVPSSYPVIAIGTVLRSLRILGIQVLISQVRITRHLISDGSAGRLRQPREEEYGVHSESDVR